MKRVVDMVMDLLGELEHTPIILVLDDEAEDRDLAKRTLSRLGYEVQMAASVDEADKLLANRMTEDQEYPFDICLVDLRLVNSPDGTEFVKILKQRAPKVPVIIITGQPEQGRLEAATELGYFGLVKKPLEDYTVRQIMDQHRIPQPAH